MRYLSRGWLILGITQLVLTAALPAAPVEIVPPDFAGARQPQVAAGDDESVYVTFGRGDELFVSISRDHGQTFSPPRPISALPGLALGVRRGPRIAVQGRSVTVTAEAQDLFAFHSSDDGETWSTPKQINRVNASAREGLHALAAGPHNRMFVTWLDLRSGDTEVFGSMSEDSGATWGADTSIYRSPDQHVCECCHPSAAFNQNGDVAVMWRNWRDGSRDMWFATRRAGETSLQPAAKFGTGTWKLQGCPMDGGAIFALADGSFGSVWRREKTVFLSLGPDDEQRIADGVQPFAVVARGIVHVFWQDGENLLHTTNHRGDLPTVVAAKAQFGAAAVLSDGQIAIVFERISEGRSTIVGELLP